MARLSAAQKKVVDRMREGYDLRWHHLGPYPFLTGPEQTIGEPVSVATLNALLDKGAIVEMKPGSMVYALPDVQA